MNTHRHSPPDPEKDPPPERGAGAAEGLGKGSIDYTKDLKAEDRTGQELYDQFVGYPALDAPLSVTLFPDQRARRKEQRRLTLRDLAAIIEATEGEDKAHLPWVKLATFGDDATERGCLRNNANVREITGVEVDYDGGSIDLDAAARRIEVAGIAGLLYSTPSSTPDVPKWRALVPLDEPHAPKDRVRFVEALNAIFDGEPDQPASFTLSQSFYFGSVAGRPSVTVRLVDGLPIDLVSGLSRLGKGKRVTDDGEVKARDESGSGALFRLAAVVKAEGGDLDDFRDRVDETPAARRHVERVEREQRGHGERAIERAWDNAPAHGGASADDFDAVPKTTNLVAFSDDHLAALLGKRCADRLRYDEVTGKWFSWQGDRWKTDAATDAQAEARALCRDLAKGDKRNAGLVSAASVASVVSLARTEKALRTRREMWDTDPMLLGVPGGTVDLRTGTVRPARPEDLISRRALVAPSSEGCCEFMDFIEFACNGDMEMVAYLQRWAGYMLTGDTREQQFLFLHGVTGTGKSSLLNIFSKIMGDYAIGIDMATLTQRRFDTHAQEIARLEGARLVVTSETEANRTWAEGRLKALTGGDAVTANLMRENARTFVPRFKLAISGNERPRLTNADPAIERRLAIVGFDRQPERRDDGLMDRLMKEAGGILRWMLDGCLSWQSEGLGRPRAVAEAVSDYMRSEDIPLQWVEDELETGEAFATSSNDLFRSWERYARSNDHEPGTIRRGFPEMMRRLGFEPLRDTRGVRGRGWRGCRVQDFHSDML